MHLMKKYIAILTVCVLVLSACGEKITSKIDETKNKVENKKTSIKELLGSGQEQKCTWKSEVEGDKSSGTMMIKGTKFRQTAVSKIGDQPETAMEILSDGVWTYLWNPKTKEQGMKIRVTEEQKADTQKLADGSFDFGKEFNFDCSPASVSDAEFTPPTDVEFMDLEALQNQFKDLMPSGVEIPTTDGE
jgi:outer membrane lipoprotein-sorting protein